MLDYLFFGSEELALETFRRELIYGVPYHKVVSDIIHGMVEATELKRACGYLKNISEMIEKCGVEKIKKYHMLAVFCEIKYLQKMGKRSLLKWVAGRVKEVKE